VAPDPRGQPLLPFAAAEAYERRVLGWADEALPDDVVAHLAQPFGSHAAQRLDVYLPRRARGDVPVLVFWHGGGWTNGWREYVRFMAPHVVRRGIALVAPSYRLVHEARLPAALDDCEAALALVQQQAARWGVAAQRLLLAGHSAGGHLAAMTALRTQQPVAGCLPISAILDLHHPAPPAGSLEERVYTSVLADRDDDARLSPIHWTRGNRVPFVLSCGALDSARVLRSNQRMAALLRLQPGSVELHVEDGADHFATHLALADPGHPWYAKLVQALT
jgi:arylformamidase